MFLNEIKLNTPIPQYPKLLNDNFKNTKSYFELFYDGSTNVLKSPLETGGKVKASKGEFVTTITDNLIVKNQFTNLYDNITTADYELYKTYVGPLSTYRDPSVFDNASYKYLDINKPYYKIDNLNDYALNVNNISQVVGIILEASIGSLDTFNILLDPCTLESINIEYTDQYIDLMCVNYDPSWGSTWTPYKYQIVGDSSSGGGVTPNDSILNWNVDRYEPYTSIFDTSLRFSKNTGTFPSSYNAPDYLILNGQFVAGSSDASNNRPAIYGNSHSNYGVVGRSVNGFGINAISDYGFGINVSAKGGMQMTIDGESALYITKFCGAGDFNNPTINLDLGSANAGSNDLTSDIINISEGNITSGNFSRKLLVFTGAGSHKLIEYNPRVKSTGSSISYLLDTENTLVTGETILSIQNNTSERFKITPETTDIGNISTQYYTSFIQNGFNIIIDGDIRTKFDPYVFDTSTSIAYTFDTDTNLTTVGSKLISVKNLNNEKCFVDKDGQYENTAAGNGIILKSPDGTRYKLSINNGGTINITAV